MRYVPMLLFTVMMFLPIGQALALEREDTVCGPIIERFLFLLWSSAAPDPDPNRVAGLKNVEQIEYMTSDNKRLVGYRYKAHNGRGEKVKPKGYLLMALGNAMISDQIIKYLRPFAQAGYDVYIYDYRGYGNSEGYRRINAFIEDYKELSVFLNASYDRRVFYGISLGGVIILNVIGSGIDFDAAVIDSSPSRLSNYGCPETIDSVKNLPSDSSKLMVITGAKDKVLNESMTKGLREEAKLKGARTLIGEQFAHPFMDSREIRKARLKIIMQFLFDRG